MVFAPERNLAAAKVGPSLMKWSIGGLFAFLLFCAPQSAQAEFRFWNLDGEEGVVSENPSVRDVLNTLRSLKRALKSAVRNRTKPGADWSDGKALFQEFFGETKLVIDGSLAGGRLSGGDSKITLMSVHWELAETEASLRRLKTELSFFEQYKKILPSANVSARSDIQGTLQSLQSKIERAEEKLESLFDLANALAEFPADLKHYHERTIEALGRSLGTDADWEVSIAAEKALTKWFQSDPKMAAAFQKAMVVGGGPTLFASSETALKLFLLAGDFAGRHLNPIERIRASPEGNWSESSLPLLAKLEKEYGVKNVREIPLSSSLKANCGDEFDRLFRSKQNPELN